jgi:hypothetical protein
MAKNAATDPNSLPSLSRVFGYIAVKELTRLEDKIRILARLGYGNEEIASICDTSPASVRTLKSVAKNRKKSPSTKKRRKKK